MNTENFVYLDETSCNIRLAREHGWALRGEPIIDYRPSRWEQNLTVVGAIRRDRVLCFDLIDGALNGEKWLAFTN